MNKEKKVQEGREEEKEEKDDEEVKKGKLSGEGVEAKGTEANE